MLSHEAEAELAARLVTLLVSRVAGSGERQRVGGQTEVREDSAYRLALGDDGEHAEPTAAIGARHHVRLEAAAEKGSPIHPRGGGVENASEQAVPVLHGEHVRGERDDVTGAGDDGRHLGRGLHDGRPHDRGRRSVLRA